MMMMRVITENLDIEKCSFICSTDHNEVCSDCNNNLNLLKKLHTEDSDVS